MISQVRRIALLQQSTKYGAHACLKGVRVSGAGQGIALYAYHVNYGRVTHIVTKKGQKLLALETVPVDH